MTERFASVRSGAEVIAHLQAMATSDRRGARPEYLKAVGFSLPATETNGEQFKVWFDSISPRQVSYVGVGSVQTTDSGSIITLTVRPSRWTLLPHGILLAGFLALGLRPGNWPVLFFGPFIVALGAIAAFATSGRIAEAVRSVVRDAAGLRP